MVNKKLGLIFLALLLVVPSVSSFCFFGLGSCGGDVILIPSKVNDLNDLSDVNYNDPTNGQALVFDFATGTWINGTVAGGAGSRTYTGLNQISIDNDANTVLNTVWIASEAEIDANVFSILQAQVPWADVNILNATRFNQDASCDNNSSCTITGDVSGASGLTTDTTLDTNTVAANSYRNTQHFWNGDQNFAAIDANILTAQNILMDGVDVGGIASDASFTTGDGTTGGGDFIVKTGDSETGDAGDITFTTGEGGTTDGSITFKIGDSVSVTGRIDFIQGDVNIVDDLILNADFQPTNFNGSATNITGSELELLSDGSLLDDEHFHNALAAADGVPNILTIDSDDKARFNGFVGIGAVAGTALDVYKSSSATVRVRTSSVDGRLRANDAAGALSLFPTTVHALNLGANNQDTDLVIDTSHNTTLGGDLRVDGGNIGLTADTDLMQLSSSKLIVNGVTGIGGSPSSGSELHVIGNGAGQIRVTSDGDGNPSGLLIARERLTGTDKTAFSIYVDSSTTTNHPQAVFQLDSAITFGSTKGARIVIGDGLGNDGFIGINTLLPRSLLDVNTDGGFAQVTIDGSSGGCIMVRDTDDSGWSKGTLLNGVITWVIDADGIC